MKIKKTLFILAFLTLLSCKKEDKSFETPEKLAAHTFEVLKNIDKKTNEEFLQEVMTYQEFKDLANNPNAKLGETIKSSLKSVSEEAFTDTSIRDFKDIKETGKALNIDWSSITFSEFKHLVTEYDDMKGLRVETYFKNKDGQIYFVKSQSFYDGKGYTIVKLAEIEPKR